MSMSFKFLGSAIGAAIISVAVGFQIPSKRAQNTPATAPVMERLASVKLLDAQQSLVLERMTDDTKKRLSVAMALSEEKQFDRALILLDNVLDADQDKYEVKFMRARLLSWSGHYAAADQQFTQLRQAYPDDADLMVSHAYVKFYSSQYYEAQSLFIQVLNMHPNYEDARMGLDRVKRALE